MHDVILYVTMNKLMGKIDELLGHINVVEKISTQDSISPCDVCKYNLQPTMQEPMREFTEDEVKAYSMALDKMYEPTGFNVFNEPCNDTISRESALNTINAMRVACDTNDIADYYLLLLEAFKQLPPVTPIRRKGYWRAVYQGDEIINYRCSECELGDTNGSTNLYGWDYCRRCGAEMESEE